jgi:hypothetical protein
MDKEFEGKIVVVPEDMNALRAFLQMEIRTKIPLSHEFIELMISVLDTQKLCTDGCTKLYDPSLAMSRTTTTMLNQIVDPDMSRLDCATEESYHYLWDSVILTVVTTVSCEGCVRGKENADGELIVPLTELHKRTDRYDAPYFLGYAAVGLQVVLTAIQKDEGGKATVQMLE